MVVVQRKRISSKQGTFAASAITRSSQAGRLFFMKQGRKWTSRAPAFSSCSIALPSIAEGHRGTIRAESPDGRTIVFTAELK